MKILKHVQNRISVKGTLTKKGVPASEDANAKLYNICNDKYGYKLFLEDDVVNKEAKEDENNENQTEHTE